MDTERFIPFKLDTALIGYMPIPRALVSMNLASTAMLIYAALLDRATLSQKNHYADEGGWVYVIYPIEHLAETFGISDTAVKRHLRQLEDNGLILRRRTARNSPNHIYLNIPAEPRQEPTGGTFRPVESAKPPRQTGRKVPANNRKEQRNSNDYYQHKEDESL